MDKSYIIYSNEKKSYISNYYFSYDQQSDENSTSELNIDFCLLNQSKFFISKEQAEQSIKEIKKNYNLKDLQIFIVNLKIEETSNTNSLKNKL